MKQNQKLTFAIGLGVVILLNIVILGWLLTEFFSGPNGPEETASTIDSGEVMTAEITTEELSTELPVVEWVEDELPLSELKKTLHTFAWGEEDGQLGEYSNGVWGLFPSIFTVEDDVIYVVDEANYRIVVYKQGTYKEIGYRDTGIVMPSSMTYQNGWLAVLDDNQNITFICKSDGSVKIAIENPPAFRLDLCEVLEIGDTYVVFETDYNAMRREMHYDWIQGEWSWGEELADVTISVSDGIPVTLGKYEDKIYYYNMLEVSSENPRYMISCETYGSRLYTMVDCSSHYILPSLALSSEGNLYIMECFEDRVEISELTLE